MTQNMDGNRTFDAFLSYSHAADSAFEPALQSAVERFGRPWHKGRARRIFRDDANLTAAPDLWAEIETALASSTCFLLLASPRAAASPWVEKEVRWWLEHRSGRRLFILLTDGEFAWDELHHVVDRARTTALPPALLDALRRQPRLVDLRPLRGSVDDDNALAWQDCVAEIVSAVDDVPKDTVVGEHVRQRRTTRRVVAGVVSALSVLLVLALGATLLAVTQRDDARSQQRIAEERLRLATARLLLRRSKDSLAGDPRTALRLAEAGAHIDPGPESRAGLVHALVSTRFSGSLAGHTDAVTAVAFTPDGHTLATAGNDHTVLLWDVRDPVHPHRIDAPLTGHTDRVWSVAFAPDGRTLATAGADNTVLLWDVGDPAHPHRIGDPLIDHTRVVDDPRLAGETGVTAVTFAPDGHTLATATRAGAVLMWDVRDPSRAHRIGAVLTAHDVEAERVTFSPDGRTLAAAWGRTVLLWDVSDPSRPHQVGRPITDSTGSGSVADLMFAPVGATLALSNENGTTLWGLDDPDSPRQLGDPITGVGVVAFAPDGRTLAIADDSGDSVLLWDVTDLSHAQRIGGPLTGHTGLVHAMAFAADGHTLATGSADRTALLWDVDDPIRAQPIGNALTGHTAAVGAVMYSRDGHTLATTGADHRLLLWDVDDPTRPRPSADPFGGDGGAVDALAFSPDGHTAATARDGAVLLRDLGDPTHPRRLGDPLPAPGAGLHAVEFAPDGLTLATATADGAVLLWDLRDPARPTRVGDSLSDAGSIMGFAPGGHLFAADGPAASVLLWDVGDPTRPRRVGDPLVSNPGTAVDNVFALRFAPDGRTLATAAEDDVALLWDVSDPSHPRRVGDPLTGHTTGECSSGSR